MVVRLLIKYLQFCQEIKPGIGDFCVSIGFAYKSIIKLASCIVMKTFDVSVGLSPFVFDA